MFAIKDCKYALLILLSSAAVHSASALDMVDEVQKCASIDANDKRLDCFDTLSQALTQAQNIGEAVEQEVVQEKSEMPADIGGSRFLSEEEQDKPLTAGRVTFCQRSYDDKYLFIFENGQIWKQSDGKRYRLKECDFEVIISRDFFGYFMEIQGEAAGKTSKIRINRKK